MHRSVQLNYHNYIHHLWCIFMVVRTHSIEFVFHFKTACLSCTVQLRFLSFISLEYSRASLYYQHSFNSVLYFFHYGKRMGCYEEPGTSRLKWQTVDNVLTFSFLGMEKFPPPWRCHLLCSQRINSYWFFEMNRKKKFIFHILHFIYK
jgi:hypothetical protein